MKMSLREWLTNHWLIEQPADAKEVLFLLAISDREVAGSGVAYAAALQSAAAALAACGYRAERAGYHFRVIDSLRLTVGMDALVVARLDRARRKRNLSDYERPDVVSRQEADEMQDLAQDVRRLVGDWLTANHPELL